MSNYQPRVVWLAAALPALLAALPSQAGIRIVSVPPSVRLPAASGTNLLLEVEVTGGLASPWLASSATATDRVQLAAAGTGRYQQNLADPRIAALLPAGRDQGEFFVFGKSGDTVAQSVAIAWVRNAADDGKVRCVVRQKGGASVAHATGERCWLDTTRIERLELQGAGARQSSAVARFGELEQPLRRLADQGLWVLDIDAALQKRLAEAHNLELEAWLGGASALFEFSLVPASLTLPENGAPFVLLQRHSGFVPGSREWLSVRIDDITMGSVMLEMVTADGGVVLAPQLVRERDHFEFALGGERYVLVVERLRNRLMGEDSVELRVRLAAGFEPDRIGLLLHAIAASDATFLREGKEYEGKAAAQFLVAKLAGHRGEGPTVDEFIDTIASRSSKTSAAYEVRPKDGRVLPMADWLRERMREIDTKQASTRGR